MSQVAGQQLKFLIKGSFSIVLEKECECVTLGSGRLAGEKIDVVALEYGWHWVNRRKFPCHIAEDISYKCSDGRSIPGLHGRKDKKCQFVDWMRLTISISSDLDTESHHDHLRLAFHTDIRPRCRCLLNFLIAPLKLLLAELKDVQNMSTKWNAHMRTQRHSGSCRQGMRDNDDLPPSPSCPKNVDRRPVGHAVHENAAVMDMRVQK